MYHSSSVMMLRYFLLILFGVPLTPFIWLASVAFLDQISQSTPVFAENAEFIDGSSHEKPPSTHYWHPQVCAIVWCYNLDITTPSNELFQCGDKWICLHWVCDFNMHCSTCKACKHCSISLQFLPVLFYDKWTKHIYFQHMKGSESVTLHLGSSVMFCVPNLLNPIMPSSAINGSNL